MKSHLIFLLTLSLALSLPSSAATPNAYTAPPNDLGATYGTLNGFATPNGLPSVAWFEWGPRGSYTQATPPVELGSGAAVVFVRTNLTGLTPHSLYQCRLVVSNALGVAPGAVQLFTTGQSVTAWGDNHYGQATPPPGLTDCVSVSAAVNYNLALRAGGFPVAWGSSPYGATNFPAGLNNVVELAAGFEHALALLKNGTVRAWGRGENGVTNVPAGLSNVVAVAAGYSHSLALKADGTVAAWGDNFAGAAVVPAGLSNVVAISCNEFNLALKSDGTVVAWGDSNWATNVPAGLSNVVAVAAGGACNFALRADGTVSGWGWMSLANPVFASMTNVLAIAAGNYNNAALRADGAVLVIGITASEEATRVPTGLNGVTEMAGGGIHLVVLGANQPPKAIPQTQAGGVNQPQEITLRATDANGDALSYRIFTLPAVGTLHQFADGSPGAAITAPNTPVTDPGGRVIFVPQTDGFGMPYAEFEFVASDGAADSSPAACTVRIGSLAFTQPPLPADPGSVTLAGMVLPNGLPSTAWFEWSGRGFNSLQTTPPVFVGEGTGVSHFVSTITGLLQMGQYECRLVLSNASGITRGAAQRFTAGSPVRGWGYGTYGQIDPQPGLTNAVSVAAGAYHSLALRANRTVVAWGLNSSGQTNTPPDLTNAVAVAGGTTHTLALSADGTLRAWGNAALPPSLTNAVAIAAGYAQDLAVTDNGRVVAWGGIYESDTNFPAGLSNVVQVAAGTGFSLALKIDGTVAACGNDYVQTNLPAALADVLAIAAGSFHALALKADGTVLAWGMNYHGETNVPPGLSNVIAIAASGYHSLALKADGTLVDWGYGSAILRPPADLSNVVAIAAGDYHDLALYANAAPQAYPQILNGRRNLDLLVDLRADEAAGALLGFRIRTLPALGTLYQFDNGIRGAPLTTNDATVSDALGRVIFAPAPDTHGRPYTTFEFVAVYSDVLSPPAVVTINLAEAMRAFTLPATKIGPYDATLNGFVAPMGASVTAWVEIGASDTYGRIEGVTNIPAGQSIVAIQVPAFVWSYEAIHFRVVVADSAGAVYGADQQFAPDGRLAAWGDNSSGQAQVPTNAGAIAVVAGGLTHSLALRHDGTTLAWGNNTHGQAAIPAGLTNVATIAAGGFHNLALLTDGTVTAWGRNNYGQTNVPAGATNVLLLAAGGMHNLALRDNGSLAAWGYNSHGQATVPAGLSNVVGIAAGWYHSVALCSNGTVVAWGNNSFGQLNVPAGLTNVVWVGAGLYHTLARRADGTVAAWGYNGSGQTDVPAGATNVAAAACGGLHNLALHHDQSLSGWGYNFYGQTSTPTNPAPPCSIAGGGNHSLAVIRNTSPVASPVEVTGYVNHDLVVQLIGPDPDGDAVSFFITSTPSPGALYQYAAGARGDLIPDWLTEVTDPGGRVIFAPATDGIGTPYATGWYYASDGNYYPPLASIILNIVLPAAPELTASASGWTAAGGFELVFTGTSNATYQVWASTNLIHWEPLGAAAPLAPGSFHFLDSSATNWPQRFYRAGAGTNP